MTATAMHTGAAARRAGFLLAAAGAVLFSAKAILAKYQYRYGLDALDVMALRMGFSLPLFSLLAVRETRRARTPLSRREFGLIVVLGVSATTCPACWTSGACSTSRSRWSG